VSLLHVCQWLATTPWSIALHESHYVYSIVSTVHVLTLSVFLGTAVMLDLRLLGVSMPRMPVSEVATRLFPWTAAGFVTMLVSGALLLYAAPMRYQNIFFRIKIFTLVLAGVNAWVFHRTVYRGVADWDLDPVPPRRARFAGGLALVFWAVMIVAGRMIAYDWFACDRQPQPAVVNLLAGCVTDAP
jgi:hypothetical protein